MYDDASLTSLPRLFEIVLNEHLENSLACVQALNQVFQNLQQAEPFIAQVKQLEERGDQLTAEAYHFLELLPYSEAIHIEEQMVKYLDDITDGMNNTARLIDICHPREIENAAYDLLTEIVTMIELLLREVRNYPNIDLIGVRVTCRKLKSCEESADLIYHEWRKKQRRVLVLSLIEENNWTEILGVLEATTDSAYHAGLQLDRFARVRQK